MNTLMQVLFVMVTLGLPIVTVGTLAYALLVTQSERQKARKSFAGRARPAPPLVSDAPTRA